MLAKANVGNRLMWTADSLTQQKSYKDTVHNGPNHKICLYMHMKFAAAHQLSQKFN
jgi:hypothetical protein